MRLLIVSPFIDPEAVGEPRWCYDLAKALSERVDSVIIAQTPLQCRSSIAELFPHAQVHETRGWRLKWMNTRMRQLLKPGYIPFYRFARRVIHDHYPRGSVSCAHQFGPLALRYPTPLHDTGIPYVMGPLGGSLSLPEGFAQNDRKEPWYYRLRDVDGWRFRHDPLLRASYRNADYLVGIGDYVRGLIGDAQPRRFAAFTETTAPPPNADVERLCIARSTRGDPTRFLIVSRLIFSKGIHLALRAAAVASSDLPDWRLDVVGDGPYRAELEALSRSLGLEGRVTFHGHVPRRQVDSFYEQADVFLFPSIREPSGVVMFEAMGWGLPMVVADYGGPTVHADPSFAMRAPVTSEKDFILAMGQAMTALAHDPDRRARMGHAALDFVRIHYSMDAMIEFYLKLYREIADPVST